MMVNTKFLLLSEAQKKNEKNNSTDNSIARRLRNYDRNFDILNEEEGEKFFNENFCQDVKQWKMEKNDKPFACVYIRYESIFCNMGLHV